MAKITLNRPHKHNALNEAVVQLFIESLDRLANTPSVQMIQLQGSKSSFCAGADIRWMKESLQKSGEENLADAKQLATLFDKLYHFPKPTLAIAQGYVFGGGIGLLACCDIAIATEHTEFCFSEAKLGLIPATIAPYIFTQLPKRLIQRYMLTAERFPATTAVAMGLVHDCVKNQAELETYAHKLSQNILSNSQESLGAIKSCSKQIAPLNKEGLEKMSELLAKIRTTKAAKNRLMAYLNA